ncbi:hypothetical protein BD410DRAFT_806726 [Rickenella mellea]|uniref:Uncharacterized protein n=1 Tax=Rickenella mellea TaxID=50990 RepID=A0A4Y7PRX6_9AGAM|nr:hypothetical protein BD410DRAFT_806726 [Rickenella mellea]
MPPDPHDLGNRHRLLQPELTGFRLLTIALTTTFGVSKAVLAYYGHSVVPTTLELVFGVIVGIALFWLGVYEDEAPGAVPWLFQTDYRRPLTRETKQGPTRRIEYRRRYLSVGGCCCCSGRGVRRMRGGADPAWDYGVFHDAELTGDDERTSIEGLRDGHKQDCGVKEKCNSPRSMTVFPRISGPSIFVSDTQN